MGNRAVITTKENYENNGVGVYLHWNGGRDSVEAFLTYCKLRGFRADSYGWARLCQIIGNYFGGSLSMGIDTINHLDCDNWDNGTYLIDNWEIVGRRHFSGEEQQSYDLNEMLLEIDDAQPEKDRLGKAFLSASVVPTTALFPGDMVYICQEDHAPELREVVGFGKPGARVNGSDVSDIPYVDRYLNNGVYDRNINNFLSQKEYRVKRVK